MSSKRRIVNTEGGRGGEFYNSIFQSFLKNKNKQHYSRFTDKGPSVAERLIRTKRNLLQKLGFLAEENSWISELPSAIKQNMKTTHKSKKRLQFNRPKKESKK